jgi:hypothetical protein
VTPKLGDAVRITVSSLGLDIGLKGAAAMAFRRSVLDSKLLREKICGPIAAGQRTDVKKSRRSTADLSSKSG